MTDMREALAEARNYIAADRDRLLNDFCTLTPERTPDRASMEDNERDIVDEADKALALIEAALAAPTPPVVQSPAPAVRVKAREEASPPIDAPAIAHFAEAGRRLAANPDLKNSLAMFANYWGLDFYTPPPEVVNAVRDVIRALIILGQESGAGTRADNAQVDPAPVQAGEPVEWQRLNPSYGWIAVRPEDIEAYRAIGQQIRALYLHPSDAYARGAEDMREKATRVAQGLVIGVPIGPGLVDGAAMARKQITAAIRALPLTEGGE